MIKERFWQYNIFDMIQGFLPCCFYSLNYLGDFTESGSCEGFL